MASSKLNLKHPQFEVIKETPVGFSWTVLFWGFIPPLFRSDWKWSGIILLVGVVLFLMAIPTGAGIIFAFFYNKLYINDLVAKGFKAYEVEQGFVAQVVNTVGSSMPIPIIEEPQASQKAQELEPKKENSAEDKLGQLNELKEKNLINDEEYNKKKEKLLEEL